MGIIGLASNTLMFAVFNSRTLRKNSVSIYFRALALSDIAMNMIFLNNFYSNASNKNLLDTFELYCKLSIYITYTLSPLPVWFLVLAGFNRFITIVFPMKLALLKKARFARILITFIVIFNIAYYMILLIDLHLLTLSSDTINESNTTKEVELSNETQKYCGFENNANLLLILDFANATLIPFIIMLSSTLATLIGVYVYHKRAQKYLGSSKSKNYQIRDLKFAVTMIILNILFLALKTMNFYVFFGSVFDILYYFDKNQLKTITYLYDFLSSFFYTMDFPLQLLTNSLVRKQFFMLFPNILGKLKTLGFN